jgi:hypothetical protein
MGRVPDVGVAFEQAPVGELALFLALEAVGLGCRVRVVLRVQPGPVDALVFRVHQSDEV